MTDRENASDTSKNYNKDNDNNIKSILPKIRFFSSCDITTYVHDSCDITTYLHARCDPNVLKRFRQLVLEKHGRYRGFIGQELNRALIQYLVNETRSSSLPLTSGSRCASDINNNTTIITKTDTDEGIQSIPYFRHRRIDEIEKISQILQTLVYHESAPYFKYSELIRLIEDVLGSKDKHRRTARRYVEILIKCPVVRKVPETMTYDFQALIYHHALWAVQLFKPDILLIDMLLEAVKKQTELALPNSSLMEIFKSLKITEPHHIATYIAILVKKYGIYRNPVGIWNLQNWILDKPLKLNEQDILDEDKQIRAWKEGKILP